MFTKFIIALLLFFNISVGTVDQKPGKGVNKPTTEKTIGTDDFKP